MTSEEVKQLLMQRTSINPQTGCWEYLGTNADGYGQKQIEGKFFYTHVLAAQVFLGYIPTPGSMVCHRPGICWSRACWNPEHLQIGDAQQNALDTSMIGNARNQNSDKTICVNGHEFTEDNTYWFTKPDGRVRRMCRTCRAIKDREAKARKKAGFNLT